MLDVLHLVVTMTLVGCGDLVPNSGTTKLFGCACVSMAIVGIFISKLADYLVEKQMFFKAEQSESKMLSTIDIYEGDKIQVLHGFSTSCDGTEFLWKS